MRRNGCYNIDANSITQGFEEDDYYESVRKPMKLRITESEESLCDKVMEVNDNVGFWTREDEFVEDMENAGLEVTEFNYEYATIEDDDEWCQVDFIRANDTFTIGNIRKCEEKTWEESYNIEEAFSSDDDLEDLIQSFEQEYDSSVTSINSAKLPTIFGLVKKLGGFKKGTLNADYGGGRFDNAAEYLKDLDVLNLVYDPFNRSKEHNKDVIDFIKKNGGADTVTCSNVLNVIKEPENRLAVIKNCDRLVKDGGTVYFTVYEGSGSGEGKANDKRKSYQTNMKTEQYQEELEKVFSNVTRKGKLFICK